MAGILKGIGAGGIAILALLLCFIGPMLMLWSINWMAELGGSSFYIEHTIWSYWVAFVFLILLRGS